MDFLSKETALRRVRKRGGLCSLRVQTFRKRSTNEIHGVEGLGSGGCSRSRQL